MLARCLNTSVLYRFLFTRLGTWFTYAQPNQLADSHEFWQAMWTGFQFDVAIIIRLGAVGILASILCIPLPVAIANFSWTLNRYLGGLILLMVIWLAMINFTYIGFLIVQLTALPLVV